MKRKACFYGAIVVAGISLLFYSIERKAAFVSKSSFNWLSSFKGGGLETMENHLLRLHLSKFKFQLTKLFFKEWARGQWKTSFSVHLPKDF
jgi:hypothetical protein